GARGLLRGPLRHGRRGLDQPPGRRRGGPERLRKPARSRPRPAGRRFPARGPGGRTRGNVMNGTSQPPGERTTAERLAQVEARLSRLEDYLQLDAGDATAPPPDASRRSEDEFEFRVGQNWFATVGILVLVIGAAFTLSLPYSGLPDAAPSLIGYGVAAALFLLARAWHRAFELVSGNLRGAAMALLYFATLRLCYFGDHHALDAASPPGQALLVLAAAANLALAIHWRSQWLAAIALASAYATALAVGSGWFALVTVTASAGAAVV